MRARTMAFRPEGVQPSLVRGYSAQCAIPGRGAVKKSTTQAP
jgi:hypothetical protein